MAVPISAAGEALNFGSPTPLFSVPTIATVEDNTPFQVTPDGRFLVNFVTESARFEIIQNWNPEDNQ